MEQLKEISREAEQGDPDTQTPADSAQSDEVHAIMSSWKQWIKSEEAPEIIMDIIRLAYGRALMPLPELKLFVRQPDIVAILNEKKLELESQRSAHDKEIDVFSIEADLGLINKIIQPAGEPVRL